MEHNRPNPSIDTNCSKSVPQAEQRSRSKTKLSQLNDPHDVSEEIKKRKKYGSWLLNPP
jgi:hypothetical protein